MLHRNRLLSQQPSVSGRVLSNVSVGPTDRDNRVVSGKALVEPQACYEFLVVVAYEDFRAGMKAMELVLHLSQSVPGPRFEVRPWRFDLLNDPLCQERAVLDGTKAELLILSSSRAHDLPQGVETWLTRTLGRKVGGTAAVVVLFATESCRDVFNSPRLRFVERAAKAAGLDFFAPSVGSEGAVGAGSREEPAAPSYPPRFHQEFQPVLPFRGWGINE